MPNVDTVLTLNAGSSSLKWALFRAGSPPFRLAAGKLERIGLPDGILTVIDMATGRSDRRTVQVADHAASVQVLIDQLAHSGKGLSMQAIGHRVVHGGSRYAAPVVMSSEVLEELRRLSPYDPEHLPADRKKHYLAPGVGHYGVFNGSRFRAEIAPRIADFILSNNEAPAARRDIGMSAQRGRTTACGR